MLEQRAGRGFDTIPRDQNYSTALALWAKVAADVHARRVAAELYELLWRWRDQVIWNGANGFGSAQFYLGMLAATLRPPDRAADHFAIASRLHQREGIKGWEARNLTYWARSMLASGAAEEAVATARQALRLAQKNGYKLSGRFAENVLASVTEDKARV